ncbi:MAG: nuclear transport factor 2 family protein [Balneola sp.]|nr:MAG: nuclear transport factor 2 family protein [Balneola sp.]
MYRLFFFLFFVATPTALKAQLNVQSELFKTLQVQDSVFFEKAFNQCDITYLDKTISDDLKFFHDQSGFQDKSIFLNNTEKYICAGQGQKPIRKLEANSLVAYPLYNNGVLYAAIQKGVHHFYLREEGKEDIYTSTADFTHVWVLENEAWKISEVLSYNHRSSQ